MAANDPNRDMTRRPAGAQGCDLKSSFITAPDANGHEPSFIGAV
jgi:hypothetical protein